MCLQALMGPVQRGTLLLMPPHTPDTRINQAINQMMLGINGLHFVLPTSFVKTSIVFEHLNMEKNYMKMVNVCFPLIHKLAFES